MLLLMGVRAFLEGNNLVPLVFIIDTAHQIFSCVLYGLWCPMLPNLLMSWTWEQKNKHVDLLALQGDGCTWLAFASGASMPDLSNMFFLFM